MVPHPQLAGDVILEEVCFARLSRETWRGKCSYNAGGKHHLAHRRPHASCGSRSIIATDATATLWRAGLGRQHVCLAAFDQGEARHRRRVVRRRCTAKIRQISTAAMSVFLGLSGGAGGVVGATRYEPGQEPLQRRMPSVALGAGRQPRLSAPPAEMTPEPDQDPRVVHQRGVERDGAALAHGSSSAAAGRAPAENWLRRSPAASPSGCGSGDMVCILGY
jgi:hypothetical protein